MNAHLFTATSSGTSSGQLHWTQRLALIRHNLHAARRTGDYSFFKTLQAHAFLEGTDYVATLTNALWDESDNVIATLDNLNAGIAYIHQDAFKNVYDSLKSIMANANAADGTGLTEIEACAQLRVDVLQQKQAADFAIDRIANSAVALVQLQQPQHQDSVANAWIMGTTIIVDAVKVCLDELDAIERCTHDFIRLEYSWQTVQTSVEAAISALRGIFNLMAPSSTSGDSLQQQQEGELVKSRQGSTASAMSMFRKFSTAVSQSLHIVPTTSSASSTSGPPTPQTPYRHSRSASSASNVTSSSSSSPSALRTSFAQANPTRMPSNASSGGSFSYGLNSSAVNSNKEDVGGGGGEVFMRHQLSPIPPTPAIVDEMVNPFDGSNVDLSTVGEGGEMKTGDGEGRDYSL